jgi:hypothetical protein
MHLVPDRRRRAPGRHDMTTARLPAPRTLSIVFGVLIVAATGSRPTGSRTSRRCWPGSNSGRRFATRVRRALRAVRYRLSCVTTRSNFSRRHYEPADNCWGTCPNVRGVGRDIDSIAIAVVAAVGSSHDIGDLCPSHAAVLGRSVAVSSLTFGQAEWRDVRAVCRTLAETTCRVCCSCTPRL